jgi:hypothetical protein
VRSSDALNSIEHSATLSIVACSFRSSTCRLKASEEREMLQGLLAVGKQELDILEAQRDQYSHDMRNHFDILALHKTDRLKHYGLHFAKYVGRIARGEREVKRYDATLVDALLVSFSAANTLHQVLNRPLTTPETGMLVFASATGIFCDACEKIDHLEPFADQARGANQQIFSFVLSELEHLELDIPAEIASRRRFLSDRHFYVR